MMSTPILEIAISTLGTEGLQRIAAGEHPAVEGVIYSVACQMPVGDEVIPEALRREDFVVRFYREKGLSRNRNRSLQTAVGEWILIADDDLSYDKEDILKLLPTLAAEKSADFFLTRYHGSDKHGKVYPEHRCDIKQVPRGFYVTSFEMLFRREAVQGKVWFNEEFGLGAPHLISGEEDIFMETCAYQGLKVEALPMYIGSHPHATTTEKNLRSPLMFEAKGAVFRYKYRRWWWLRLPLSGLKETLKGTARVPLHQFIRYTFRGAITYGAKVVKEGGGKPLL
jgi:glycosyltransferase involved in cell wall biosynthesis